MYLIEGDPGSGKTTLALQYLMEGVRRKEAGLYVTLSETKEELQDVAASHGWTLDGLEIVELVAEEQELDPDNQYTMFQPSEIQLGETTKAVLAEVERIKPKRVVIDSLSELRLLAQSALRYRRQILALKQFFAGRKCTVLLLDDRTSDSNDLQLQSIAHGVLSLEHFSPGYGAERRRLRVAKLRGQRFRGVLHDFNIAIGGLEVFPRLVAAANQAHRAALFIFDERIEVLLRRVEGLGMDLRPLLDSGLVTIQQVDPAELSPGEFAHAVRKAVNGADGHAPATAAYPP
jgi:circadian clock protein KaiC